MKGKAFQDLSVLTIDDDPQILELNVALLHGLGVERVWTADSGSSAMAFFQQDKFSIDVIVSDINMPSMDGVELMRHLGESKIRAGIILASGEDSRMLHAVAALSRSHGLYLLGILQKPLNLERLAALLAEYDSSRSDEMPLPVDPIAEQELAEGCGGDSVLPMFQPQVRLRDGAVFGVEALVRWNHPTRGILGPAAFVPLAESSGHIDTLTATILRKSLSQYVQWKAAGLDLHVSVNVSVKGLHRLNFPEYVLAQTVEAGVEPSRLTLELTESHVMKHLKSSMEILTRLRLKRHGLSLDDFGTGYSSMEQLKSAPFTELKIDRSFVSGAKSDPAARAILEISTGLGKKLDMTVVAEGVETQEDWDLVRDAGCDLVQGYFVAKPMPGDRIVDWAKDWESKG